MTPVVVGPKKESMQVNNIPLAPASPTIQVAINLTTKLAAFEDTRPLEVVGQHVLKMASSDLN
jgi:hypothetical protein